MPIPIQNNNDDHRTVVPTHEDDASEYNDFESIPQKQFTKTTKGRSAGFNPANRFDEFHSEKSLDDITDEDVDPEKKIPSEYIRDTTKSILSKNDSPDIPFTYSINPYRGCEHGCIYCYARPSHEYLGYSSGLDFETKILVKYDAAQLLEKEFRKSSWRPEPICVSGNTDCYQPAERKLQLTRGLLKVFLRYQNPVRLITKNFLITRDLDILSELAKLNLVGVMISITTLDTELARKMEPRTASPTKRFHAIELLAKNNIPVGVMTAPMIPGLNDHEMPEILRLASEAGATSAGYTVVRLTWALKALFKDWLERTYPTKKEKIIHAIQDTRDGKLASAEFGKRMTGEGEMAEHIAKVFKTFTHKYGLNKKIVRRKPAPFLRGGIEQFNLF
ncbi:PA0069 family radical SAM protein [bacterium]|nr:PA0069 family radical SAM protein [bacterium]